LIFSPKKTDRKKNYIFLLIFILSSSSSAVVAGSSPFTGKVISVSDGDTITVLKNNNEQVKIRLSGVDCPEGGQAYGKKAKSFISSMVFKKSVTVEPETTDRYGRTVAMVLTDGRNLSEQLIARGYGWVFRKYCTWAFCDDWLRLEEKARLARIGLWADDNPVPPWDWRAEQRRGSGASALGNVNNLAMVGGSSGTGLYHGNIESHVFHSPGCQHYTCKNCSVEVGSVEAAVEAGYREHEQFMKE